MNVPELGAGVANHRVHLRKIADIRGSDHDCAAGGFNSFYAANDAHNAALVLGRREDIAPFLARRNRRPADQNEMGMVFAREVLGDGQAQVSQSAGNQVNALVA